MHTRTHARTCLGSLPPGRYLKFLTYFPPPLWAISPSPPFPERTVIVTSSKVRAASSLSGIRPEPYNHQSYRREEIEDKYRERERERESVSAEEAKPWAGAEKDRT